ncbi:MAG: Rieske 2Fe-2S domain-containing protein [Acidimicrobiales bacterium]
MTALIIGIAVLVVLALVVVLAASRRSDTGEAIGSISRETIKRDSARRSRADAEQAATIELDEETVSGKVYEKAVVAARQQESRDLVLAGTAAPAQYVAPDPEQLGVTRRMFFNRSIIAMFGLGLSGFGAACIAFLWPSGASGFGSKLNAGLIGDLIGEIRANNGFLYKAEGRMWLTEYPAGAIEKARLTYSAPELAGMTEGVLAIYQKCPHLGCRVPSCGTSQWFECPCHGSQYNRVGEKRGGPAPRGMDRFAMTVSDKGELIVDTGTIVQGPPIGTNTTGQEAEGPHCIGSSEGHG